MRYFAVIIGILWTMNVAAQEPFEEQRDKLMGGFNEFRSSIMNDYKVFREKILKDYCEMLKQAWSELDAFSGIPLPVEKQLPPMVFPEKDIDKPLHDTPKPIEEVIRPVKPQPQPKPVVPVRPKPEPAPNRCSFTFLGTEVTVRLDKSEAPVLRDNDIESVSAFWEELCDDRYDAMVEDCLTIREKLSLCDWAYLLFLRELGNTVYKDNHDSAVLMMLYVYCLSGYAVRLALTENDSLCLMYASQHVICDKLYWEYDGTKYYALDFDGNRISISTAHFPGEQPLSLLVPNNQHLAYAASAPRSLVSKRYPDVSVSLSVNKNLIDFYNTYPTSTLGEDFMTRWAMYANTPMDDNVKKTLYPALGDKIKGLEQQDAANRLINWVQTAFIYEYDDKVWGHDRAFFAEESLYYPYCDCEDRSILFSRLVRDLLGLNVVLVFYPGHLATAVNFTEDVKGDYIVVDGKKYVICDPTYMGAPVGWTMKGMDNATCKAILLDNASR